MEEEIWKDIPGYEGSYQASNLGRIKSFKRNRIKILSRLKVGEKRSCKYFTISLSKNNAKKRLSIHRLIIYTFSGLDIKKDVNHIDGNGRNNHINNLEYCSRRENLTHENVKRKKKSIYVGVGWRKRDKKWTSQIWDGKNKKWLGYHKNELDAKKAYDTALEKINELNK